MKVMIRRSSAGVLSAYVPKKDLEEPIVSQDMPELWGGNVTLANGWVLALPEMAAGTSLPITVEARRLSGGAD
ncbi:putative nitrogen fixation protein NifT [Ideonella azotifigens]|uniref:Nitrogen fixation protein NifT n=1 Tax=Ideonella azotifigens TaxID=513160 RepID=A0ABN1JVB1_9BURK|nr:putative nitrogen fixation protein NifT [Ideonella azotifigens]MCD2343286.1 putative nitrogen fixation protein NifT [Ideonella azotifigens]